MVQVEATLISGRIENRFKIDKMGKQLQLKSWYIKNVHNGKGDMITNRMKVDKRCMYS